MHKLITLIFISTCLFCSGCHASMTGKVIDAETGKPIEGAILLVEWTKAKGMIGLTYTVSAKVAEVFSDKDGNVTVPSYFNPFAGGPDITIYKPGYVAWNNHWIFPDRRNRADFEWNDGYIFRLEQFREGFSYVKHHSFVGLCTNSTLSYESKKQFMKIYERHESDKYKKELLHE